MFYSTYNIKTGYFIPRDLWRTSMHNILCIIHISCNLKCLVRKMVTTSLSQKKTNSASVSVVCHSRHNSNYYLPLPTDTMANISSFVLFPATIQWIPAPRTRLKNVIYFHFLNVCRFLHIIIMLLVINICVFLFFSFYVPIPL